MVENSKSAINTIIYLELIQGAKNKAEVGKIESGWIIDTGSDVPRLVTCLVI